MPEMPPIIIEFEDDFQDMDPQPVYELVSPVLRHMTECPTRYGGTRGAFVQAMIPWIELLLEDVDDEELMESYDRDSVYEELCELYLGGGDGGVNEERPDVPWAAAVVVSAVAYAVARRVLCVEAMLDDLRKSGPGSMVS